MYKFSSTRTFLWPFAFSSIQGEKEKKKNREVRFFFSWPFAFPSSTSQSIAEILWNRNLHFASIAGLAVIFCGDCEALKAIPFLAPSKAAVSSLFCCFWVVYSLKEDEQRPKRSFCGWIRGFCRYPKLFFSLRSSEREIASFFLQRRRKRPKAVKCVFSNPKEGFSEAELW